MRLLDFANLTDNIDMHAADGYVKSSTYHERGNTRAHMKAIKERREVRSSYISDANMPEASVAFASPARYPGTGVSKSSNAPPSSLSRPMPVSPIEIDNLITIVLARSRQQPVDPRSKSKLRGAQSRPAKAVFKNGPIMTSQALSDSDDPDDSDESPYPHLKQAWDYLRRRQCPVRRPSNSKTARLPHSTKTFGFDPSSNAANGWPLSKVHGTT
ncbi:hypothetical protein MVLG_01398 [Microbotryum lychnidis-dioicae p1A1 Lamole]|uniref:Uncharacterized protein n=1 Tax=Microbotryum lychnidis-dioicae (strain p1A1 Lamole / MvSl-1064) TaxID=683840 RepID=U5H203_USTV1|nr:hypothetical protein MVLG_01398 [Microbotryum lychnidis-dioicae p1A1 Lamole]|eukprot:KDE08358.1 hypothetical protein MVLG_01398 [Microbotryum lychnidis-dioicae p1A1 Lamole]